MKIQPTVLLVANDDRLCHETACQLRNAGFDVRTGADSAPPGADVVIRDWRAEPWQPQQSVPLVTVDLGVVQGEELSEIVVRVLGFPASATDAPVTDGPDLDPQTIRH